jgi:hypothetical protein
MIDDEGAARCFPAICCSRKLRPDVHARRQSVARRKTCNPFVHSGKSG